MDPNEIWRRILDIQAEIARGDLTNEAELDFLQEDLEDWIVKGGFLPDGYLA